MDPSVAERLVERLPPMGFEPFAPEGIDGHLFLRRRTWNTNRAVAVVDLPQGQAFEAFVRAETMALSMMAVSGCDAPQETTGRVRSGDVEISLRGALVVAAAGHDGVVHGIVR